MVSLTRCFAALVTACMPIFVTGCGGGGSGSDAIGPVTPPSAPTALAAFADDGSVTVSWAGVAGAEEYDVVWSLGSTVLPPSGTTIADVTSPYVHTGLVNGNTYSYSVKARNTAGESELSTAVTATPLADGATRYEPMWNEVAASSTTTLAYDGLQTPEQNGQALIDGANGLLPGEELVVASGTWVLPAGARIVVEGFVDAPIRIRAAVDGGAVLEAASGSPEFVLGLGGGALSTSNEVTRYVQLRGFEITGGAGGIDFGRASYVWVDRCHVHDVGGQGVLAAAFNTDHLHVTRCEIHDTGGFGEGIALGSNSTGTVTHHSVIALNHVHDTRGTIEGDGIDLRWHCYANWIAENRVHHTKYPAILFHGTGGNAVNLIERNICWDTQDNVMQADEGEAIVRNNLLLGPCVNKVFDSTHNQATLRDLTVVHNTMFAQAGYCVGLFGWNGQPNLVFANNAVFSNDDGPSGYAIAFSDGFAGGTLAGNVVVGYTLNVTSGFTAGVGLLDLANVGSWAYEYGSLEDLRPHSTGTLVGAADGAWTATYDLVGTERVDPIDAGALEAVD